MSKKKKKSIFQAAHDQQIDKDYRFPLRSKWGQTYTQFDPESSYGIVDIEQNQHFETTRAAPPHAKRFDL